MKQIALYFSCRVGNRRGGRAVIEFQFDTKSMLERKIFFKIMNIGLTLNNIRKN